ncbi:MAG: NAD-dependent epimerase/dehydratase family protein [Longimicrobiales bacterium]|nr:NAD-dependent epimerase/dehydratase family protein [Longimicrobiales bacterium]
MSTKRRDFLKTTAAAGGALALGFGGAVQRVAGAVAPGPAAIPAPPPAPRALRILILGGTNLTGPHIVRYALERAHEISIFTRGRTKPGLFQDAFEHVEHLLGDRADNLEALKGRTWDVCIDSSGSNAQWTRDSAELLRDAVGSYMYISSTGVYYPYPQGITEDTEVKLVDPSGGENGSARFGVMKALSEIEARKVFGERTCVVRPTYIVGPLDGTNRGTYWPERLRRGGEVLVPGRKTDQVQQIDVRDLTEWMVHLLENGTHGTFNAVGPAAPLTMEEFVYGMRATTSAEVRWTWIEDYEFLQEHKFTGAIPWILPAGDYLGSQSIDNSRAKAAGLTFRPAAVTAMDTLAWFHSDAVTDEERASPPMALSPEREAELLDAWKRRQG